MPSRSPVSRRTLLPLATLALSAACCCASACRSSDEEDALKGARGIVHPRQEHGYPLDDVLRMNHVQVKATHNSYHVETKGNQEASWRYTQAPLATQLEAQGVRAVELDTRYIAAAGRFEVFHMPFLDEQTTCRAFADCLAQIKGWSDAHPAHTPILIQIEPKDVPDADAAEDYFAKMDAEILGVWPRERIVTPDDVQRESPTLREAIASRGWLTLGQARGKILFYVDNTDHFRALYTRGGTSLEHRLMFVDADAPDDPLASVMILNDPSDKARIDAAIRAGLIVRTRADASGEPEKRALALASGAQIVSSDFPSEFAIPSGSPARCSPLAAPPTCTPGAIEEPARLR
jgi:calcium-dependent phosphoinositide phospholipase C